MNKVVLPAQAFTEQKAPQPFHTDEIVVVVKCCEVVSTRHYEDAAFPIFQTCKKVYLSISSDYPGRSPTQ